MAKSGKIREVLSTGGVLINKNGEVLFCHPTRSRRNNWRMPKGTLNEGENIRAAALREVLEETGWRCRIVSKLDAKARYRSSDDGGAIWKNLTLYLMEPLEEIQKPDWENDAFQWVPIEKAEECAAKVDWPLIREAIEKWRGEK